MTDVSGIAVAQVRPVMGQYRKPRRRQEMTALAITAGVLTLLALAGLAAVL
ncbi:MAG: hypothetical protein HYR51_17420 [Candidatus Rokubacteria bacterium]|nr:hypothetical protein [Candidatus Rokubacteria bacterium]